VKTKILLILGCLTPLVVWAVDPVPMDVKLGLWETTMTNQMDIASLVPPEELSKMTPEQRAKMEAAMSGRGGAQMNTSKHCITKETLNEAFSNIGRGNSKATNCTQTVVSSTSSKRVIHMDCTSATMKTSSEIQVEAIDRENTKESIVTTAAGGSRNGNLKIDLTSKWLGPDCGEVGQKKN
jgi:hypothetical protein